MTSYMNVFLLKFWLAFSDPKILHVIQRLRFIPDSKIIEEDESALTKAETI